MASFIDVLKQVKSSSQDNNSSFGNNQSLFNHNLSNQRANLFMNQENDSILGDNNGKISLFHNNNNFDTNNNNFFRSNQNPGYQMNYGYNKYNMHNNNNKNQKYGHSLGFKFTGKYDKDMKLMTITSIYKYDHASQEELRLADYEKYQTGNVDKYKILNTQDKNKDILTNKQGFNDNNKPGNNSLFQGFTNGTNGIFSGSNFNQENSKFNNNNNEINNLINNDNNRKINGGLFGHISLTQKGLFNNNNSFLSNLNTNKEDNNKGNIISNILTNNNNSLFNKNNENLNNENNTFPLIGNNKEENKTKSFFVTFNSNFLVNTNNMRLFNNGDNKTLNFLENNNNSNKAEDKGLVVNIPKSNNNDNNNGFIGQNNNIFSNSLVNNDNINAKKNQILFEKAPNNILNNNNMNSIMNNNETNNFNSNVDLNINESFNPLQYLSPKGNMNLSSEDKILSNIISEAVQKRKSMNIFLKELERKYDNKENNDYNNNDILANYGTYLENSGNENYNNNNEISLLNSKENSKSLKNKTVKESRLSDKRFFNEEEMSNLLSKVNSIYQEYEKYKNIYKNNWNKKKSIKANFVKRINKISKKPESKINTNQNDILGRNEAIYHKNMIGIDKLINNEIKINKDNKTLNKNNKDNGNNPQEINSSKNIDLKVKYNLPNNNDKILNVIKVNRLIKIKDLIEEMKSKINQELKSQELDNQYSIKKLSLYISGNSLLEANILRDYDLNKHNDTIDAFITYDSITNKKEKENQLVPIELLPKLTKEGYNCIPTIIELSRKTKDELKKIEGFKIYNKYGEVEFLEPSDLLGIDLDEQVTIEQKIIETGEELDYNSKFKLYNIKVGENGINNYKIELGKLGGKLLEYKNNQMVWEYIII